MEYFLQNENGGHILIWNFSYNLLQVRSKVLLQLNLIHN